jgi:DNA-binding MarR family transcriptional regulator
MRDMLTDPPAPDPQAPERRRLPRRPRQRYYPERPLAHERTSRDRDSGDAAQAATELLIAAGSLVSALRKPLKQKGIDIPLARLLLSFRADYPRVRIGELAWRLGLTTGATSRLVDRADARFLVDRHYSCVDRRGTTVTLTRDGWALRDEVAAMLGAQAACKTARIPSPMMNRPPSPYASSSQPRAFQT